ncbi:MAG: xanthine dehydrogenase family protein subunit M, partial [Chloroflexota bacterium]|nr:xanthine dehydrogenase family protein subunit M [Chloroflexota bacterium]
MRRFEYARPHTLAEAIALLEHEGEQARVLAGGTDLIIRLRDRTLTPAVVIDIKRIPEMVPQISEIDGVVRVSAGTVMTDIHDSALMQRWFPALVDAARYVGSVQIRNRATLVGNICNASPAADTAPPQLVYGAVVVAFGPDGERRIPLDEFFVRSGQTTLGRAELVTAIEFPRPTETIGSAFQRRTRRRGHDLASVTVALALSGSEARLAFGSLGPRPRLLVGPPGSEEELLARAESEATPSPSSMRAGPEYRLAMLGVL